MLIAPLIVVLLFISLGPAAAQEFNALRPGTGFDVGDRWGSSLPFALPSKDLMPSAPSVDDLDALEALIGRSSPIGQSPSAVDGVHITDLNVRRAIDTAIADWRTVDSAPVPQSALRLIYEDRFKFRRDPDFHPPISIDPIVLPRLYPIDRFEVAPDDGVGTITGGYDMTPIPPAVLSELKSAPETTRQSLCGDAVRRLRTPDRIFNFEGACLFGDGSLRPPPLSTNERIHALACAAAYNDFVDYCLSEIDSNPPNADELRSRIGVIIARARVGGQLNIVCSGSRVARGYVVTARHCLRRMGQHILMDRDIIFRYITRGGVQADVDIYEVRLPYDYEARKLPDAAAIFSASGNVDRSADLMLLRIADEALDLSDAFVNRVVEPHSYQRVVLGGFQQLVVNAMKLNARLKGEPLFSETEFLNSNVWKEALAYDATPTCLVLKFSDEDAKRYGLNNEVVYGNFCQSFEGASGGGLFAISDVDGSIIGIVGVLSQALNDTSLGIGQTVESVRPRNTLVGIDTAAAAILFP